MIYWLIGIVIANAFGDCILQIKSGGHPVKVSAQVFIIYALSLPPMIWAIVKLWGV